LRTFLPLLNYWGVLQQSPRREYNAIQLDFILEEFKEIENNLEAIDEDDKEDMEAWLNYMQS